MDNKPWRAVSADDYSKLTQDLGSLLHKQKLMEIEIAALRQELEIVTKERDRLGGIIDMLNADMPCDISDMYPELFDD